MPTICYHHRRVSLPTLLWMLIDAIIGFDQYTHTHTHTLALFLSLRYLALFPLLSVSHKNPLADYFGINWNTDFNVPACSHYKGSINTKNIIKLIIIAYYNHSNIGNNIIQRYLISWKWYENYIYFYSGAIYMSSYSKPFIGMN